MSVVGASILLFLISVVLLAPRRWALLAMVAGVLFLTKGESAKILGVNFYAFRLLEIAGFVRVIFRGEVSFERFTAVDRALFLAYGYLLLAFLLRTTLGGGTSVGIEQVSTMDKVGSFVDVVFCYLTFRGLIADAGDLMWFLRSLTALLVPFVALVSVERLTGNNPFAVVGGMPNVWIEAGGRIRCWGSFLHPSLLGTFGASFLALYVALVAGKTRRGVGIVGLALCAAIVFLSGSGGPATFVAITILAWLLWFVRTRMRAVRWAIGGSLALLALVMKAPLWFLPDKMSLIFGGDGWHRSYLMHQFLMHFDRWWLSGMPLDDTRSWFPYLVKGAVDITNVFVLFGLDAGIFAIVLLVYLLAKSFGQLGRAMEAVRANAVATTDTELLMWGLGAVLVGHIANFFAITYFDQTYAVWLLQVAAIASISQAALTVETQPRPVDGIHPASKAITRFLGAKVERADMASLGRGATSTPSQT